MVTTILSILSLMSFIQDTKSFRVESDTPVSFEYIISGDTAVFETPHTFEVDSEIAKIYLKSMQPSTSLKIKQLNSDDNLSARGYDIQLLIKGSLVQVKVK